MNKIALPVGAMCLVSCMSGSVYAGGLSFNTDSDSEINQLDAGLNRFALRTSAFIAQGHNVPAVSYTALNIQPIIIAPLSYQWGASDEEREDGEYAEDAELPLEHVLGVPSLGEQAREILGQNGGNASTTTYEQARENARRHFKARYVAPVPEPEVYALMLGGVGLVGFMARRRRCKSA